MRVGVRVSLDFSEEAYKKLRSMAEIGVKTGTQKSSTNAETVQKALALYGWYLTTREEGRSIQLEKNGRVKEVQLFTE